MDFVKFLEVWNLRSCACTVHLTLASFKWKTISYFSRGFVPWNSWTHHQTQLMWLDFGCQTPPVIVIKNLWWKAQRFEVHELGSSLIWRSFGWLRGAAPISRVVQAVAYKWGGGRKRSSTESVGTSEHVITWWDASGWQPSTSLRTPNSWLHWMHSWRPITGGKEYYLFRAPITSPRYPTPPGTPTLSCI